MALKVPKAVKSIRIVEIDSSGVSSTRRLDIGGQRGSKSASRKKKVSKRFRPQERHTRRIARALRNGMGEYLKQHDRSNQKKRNGWQRDLSKNLERAQDKMLDQLIP